MSEMESEGCVERWELKQEKTDLPSFDFSGFSLCGSTVEVVLP